MTREKFSRTFTPANVSVGSHDDVKRFVKDAARSKASTHALDGERVGADEVEFVRDFVRNQKKFSKAPYLKIEFLRRGDEIGVRYVPTVEIDDRIMAFNLQEALKGRAYRPDQLRSLARPYAKPDNLVMAVNLGWILDNERTARRLVGAVHIVADRLKNPVARRAAHGPRKTVAPPVPRSWSAPSPNAPMTPSTPPVDLRKQVRVAEVPSTPVQVTEAATGTPLWVIALLVIVGLLVVINGIFVGWIVLAVVAFLLLKAGKEAPQPAPAESPTLLPRNHYILVSLSEYEDKLIDIVKANTGDSATHRSAVEQLNRLRKTAHQMQRNEATADNSAKIKEIEYYINQIESR